MKAIWCAFVQIHTGVIRIPSNFYKNPTVLNKELLLVEKKEKKLENAAYKEKTAAWKLALESKIPHKVHDGLESAFCKAFALIFNRGRAFIEKSYNKHELMANHDIRNYAVQVKGGRREFRQIKNTAQKSAYTNMSLTALEGIGLGAMGIGLPDIVLFLATLLKGIYETALNYGFEYESKQEQFFILKMMEISMCNGNEWIMGNREIDTMLAEKFEEPDQEILNRQMQATSSAFATDMLVLKFVQGLPIVGLIGGAANPFYYAKVMNYVHLKYRKRYLMKLSSTLKS